MRGTVEVRDFETQIRLGDDDADSEIVAAKLVPGGDPSGQRRRGR